MNQTLSCRSLSPSLKRKDEKFKPSVNQVLSKFFLPSRPPFLPSLPALYLQVHALANDLAVVPVEVEGGDGVDDVGVHPLGPKAHLHKQVDHLLQAGEKGWRDDGGR